MKVECTQENLSKGLSVVGRSVGTRTTLPVLNNILLKTEKGGLKISATDLEVGISTWIGAKVDLDGAITVPAKLLLEFVANNKDKKIIIEQKELTLKISSEHFNANIKGIDAAEFPLIPEVKKDSVLEVKRSDFEEAVSKTVIASALDETRPVLAGVYIYSKGDQLKFVATDSYRLAEQTVKLAKKPEKDFSLIIPQRTMIEVSRILGTADSVLINASENQVEFVLGDTTLVSRLIEGAFPDYQQIIPKKSETTLEVGVNDFTGAIKMASLFARESANNIKIKLASPDEVEVIAVSPHLGDNVSKVTGQVKGEPIEIAFNAKFILDVLQVIDSEKITIEFSGNMAAAVLRGDKNPNYLYVIMPLRIDE